MVTRNDVYSATHEYRYFNWGYTNSLDIGDTEFPIEWVENSTTGKDYDYTGSLKAVFKITLDDEVRYFAKEGYNRSHEGSDWDGDFYECTPILVTKTEYEKI